MVTAMATFAAPAPVRVARATNGSEIRPEIQALRALAVLTVVTYHLWPTALPGGFVGVDVFFAISGFLITSLLLREIDATGRLSLPRFWARRARRILPAAFAVLLFCALATMLLVPFNERGQFLDDIRASTAYVQNWHLAASAVSYFANDQGPSPVQHFWSLSAEEQFYLVWPVLLVFALAGTARMRRSRLALTMAVSTALSLAFGLYDTATDPAAAYFSTPARAWEFGAGGLLALAPNPAASRAGLRTALSWTGLAAIAIAAVTFSDATPFPGWAALLPVVGALAVIRAGTPDRRPTPTPLLSSRPVQLIGGLSYSIYLWHWPLLILAAVALHAELGTRERLGVLALTLVVAWLSKTLIEEPVRSARFLVKRRAAWTLGLAAAVTAAVLAVGNAGTTRLRTEVARAAVASQRIIASRPSCFGAAARDPLKPCVNPRLRGSVVPTPTEARTQPNAPCHIVFYLEGKDVCEFGVPAAAATQTIAIIGDSHAGVWRIPLDKVARAERWHGLRIGHASCPLSAATRAIPEPNRSHCNRWRKAVFSWLTAHPQVRTVFVSQLAAGAGVLTRNGQRPFDAAVAGYAAAWNALPASVGRIIVIRDNPTVDADTDTCIERALAEHRDAGHTCALVRDRAIDPDPAATAAARTASPRVQLVDLTPFFCDRRQCFPVIGGVLVYKDTTHLTGLYAQTLGPYLLRAVDSLSSE